jgi:AAA ATPase-like protein
MSRAFFEAVHADPWAQDFLDLAALNAHASTAVQEAIEHVRGAARAEARGLRSTSIVILGPPGAGKTHLFARLRRKLGPRAVFVLVRPLVHTEMTPSFVLGEIVRQLAFAAPRGLAQASALVGAFLGRLDGVGPAFPSTVLSEYTALSEEGRSERLETALEGMLALCPEVDETYLARLLRVPFSPSPVARAQLAWLSGMDCDEEQLRRIGATAPLGEARALSALRTLGATAALGSPIVLVFDQLENLMDASGGGPRLRAYANLVAELVDTLRGTVLVQLALDSEWNRGIEPTFNPAQRSRIIMRREVLALPTAAERQSLLELYYQHLLTPKGPFPWPLGAARLAELASAPDHTPRMLLSAFKSALDRTSDALAGARDAEAAASSGGSDEAPPSSRAPESAPRAAADRRDIASDWLARLRGARETVRAASAEHVPLHPARLADGLLLLGRLVPGLAVTAKARPPAQLSLELGDGIERVAILQESNHRSLALVLARLTRLTQQASVLVLRERERELPESWSEARARRDALLATGRARWLDIDAEDCARLLALASLLQAARSGDVNDSRGQPVSEEEVLDWVEATLDVAGWPLSAALARQPARAVAADAARSAPDTDREKSAPRSYIQELGGGQRRAVAPERSSALPTLQKLRVASFERLVREVLRVDPGATRASVLAELDAAGDHVRWLGRSIVFLRGHE